MSTDLIPKNKKKSILYISVYDPHVPLTGAGTRGAEFVNYLSQLFYLDLVYIDGSGQPPIPELTKKFSGRLQNVREKYCISFSQLGYFIFSSPLYKAAKNLLKKYKYDFLICDYGLSAIYGIMLSKSYNVPFVYCSHNIEYLGYLGKSKRDVRRLLLAPYVYWVEKLGVKKSKILVAITKIDAKYYLRWTNDDKIIIIPQGFDDAIFHPNYEPSENIPSKVLFCGNFNIQTNLDVVKIVMEKFLGKVLAVFPNTKFCFVGANPPRDIRHPNVEFTGFIDDYPSHLKKADVVISPILQGWGAPTKIIEALACGKPIIATETGARAVERDYESLKVCELEQFPEMICDSLARNKPVTRTDFEKLKNRYSWTNNLKKLTDRFDTVKP